MEVVVVVVAVVVVVVVLVLVVVVVGVVVVVVVRIVVVEQFVWNNVWSVDVCRSRLTFPYHTGSSSCQVHADRGAARRA